MRAASTAGQPKGEKETLYLSLYSVEAPEPQDLSSPELHFSVVNFV